VSETVLVTGAAGFVGSHLLDQLEGTSSNVVAWRRPEDRLPAGRTGHELRWMQLNLLDRERVRAAVAEVRPTIIYHCAGAAHLGASWGRTGETLAVNVLGTHHLLEAVRLSGAGPRILVPGSSYVYRPQDRALVEADPVGPTSPYALSKLAQEMAGIHAWRDDGLQVLVTRSFNHIGPRQDPSFFASGVARQIAMIEIGRAEPVIQVGNLAARRDLTDVRDTVRAYRLLVDRGGAAEIYNVCSGCARPVGEVLDLLLAAARAPISVRVDPSRYRPHDAPLILGNPGRLRALGWTPEVPIEQTLQDLLASWRLAVAPPAGASPRRGARPVT
jgi:GDP-4-dehydro-6-deoxy-D-mannose reductase